MGPRGRSRRTDSRGQGKIHKGDQVEVGRARDLSSQQFIIYYGRREKHGGLQHKTWRVLAKAMVQTLTQSVQTADSCPTSPQPTGCAVSWPTFKTLHKTFQMPGWFLHPTCPVSVFLALKEFHTLKPWRKANMIGDVCYFILWSKTLLSLLPYLHLEYAQEGSKL